MGREYELKFAATGEILNKMAAELGDFTKISMETEYFDTPSGALSARKWTLRSRRENGTCVCTLKTPAADGSRGEWELAEKDITLAIPVLCKLGAPAELLSLTREGLIRVCGARFTRLAKQVELSDAACELALDEGSLLGKQAELPFFEVEAELKSGKEAAVAAYATALAEKYGLHPEERSKFQRALALAEGE